MLSDEEKRAILLEERARFEAERQAQAETEQAQAREVYRAQARRAMRSRPPRWGWWLLLSLLWAGAAVVFLSRQQAATPNDTSGGIASSALMQRCEGAVLSQLGQLAAEFPAAQEAASQISASSEGKRWDGWVASRPNFVGRTDFSCVYSPPTDSIQVQLLGER